MFDIAVLEQFGPLYAGATVHIDGFGDRKGRPCCVRCSASADHGDEGDADAWRMLVDAGWHGDDRLRMLVGGEALDPEFGRRLLPHGELWNMYGPTETTVWSAIKRIDDADDITMAADRPHPAYVLRDGAALPVSRVSCASAERAWPAATGSARPDRREVVENPYGLPVTGSIEPATWRGCARPVSSNASAGSTIRSRFAASASNSVKSNAASMNWPASASPSSRSTAPDDSEPRLVAYVIPAHGEDFSPEDDHGCSGAPCRRT